MEMFNYFVLLYIGALLQDYFNVNTPLHTIVSVQVNISIYW